jgi:hypothetical protein
MKVSMTATSQQQKRPRASETPLILIQSLSPKMTTEGQPVPLMHKMY